MKGKELGAVLRGRSPRAYPFDRDSLRLCIFILARLREDERAAFIRRAEPRTWSTAH